MSEKHPRSILFVCLGNICRSPLAEGLFRTAAAEAGHAGRFVIDSAGTSDWHVGDPPDPRSISVAARHGIDIAGQRARQVHVDDFARFDLILGMDRSNVAGLRALAPVASPAEIGLYLDVAGIGEFEVPDPYTGGAENFLAVYRIVRQASESLVARLVARDVSWPESVQASSTM